MNLKNLRSNKRQSGRRRRGVSAIEFALVAPAFITVIVVCAEFARLSMMRNLAHNAAYESARFIMAEGALVSDGIEKANDILGRVGTVGAQITINGSDGSVDGNGDVTGEISAQTEIVRCSIRIPLADNSVIIPDYIFGDTEIRASMSVRTERYRGYYESSN